MENWKKNYGRQHINIVLIKDIDREILLHAFSRAFLLVEHIPIFDMFLEIDNFFEDKFPFI